MQKSDFDGGLIGGIGISILSFINIFFIIGIESPEACVLSIDRYTNIKYIEWRRLKFVGTGLGLFGHFIKW